MVAQAPLFQLIESKREIAEAQKELEQTIRKDFRQLTVRTIGYPGGRIKHARVYTDGRYWLWSHEEPHRKCPRHVNCFGILPDSASIDLGITVQVNPPYSGRDDRVGGFFARNIKTGSISLFHSGRVGGGAKGVGKMSFLTWDGEGLTDVVDSQGRTLEGILVMPIKGPAATRMTIRYIERAAQFKEAVRRGHIRQNEFKQRKDAFQDFYSERHGERKGKRTSEIDYFSYHGLIVDELHAVRKKLPFSKGAKPAKNYFVDLAVRSGNDLVEIYEVKTSSSRQNVYHAIGQLLVHGKANPCKRVIVLPDTEALKHDLESALQRLRIEIWKFKLGRNNKVTIVR